MIRALWHQENLKTCCQEILERPAVAATNTYLLQKGLGRDRLYLQIRKAPVTIQSSSSLTGLQK